MQSISEGIAPQLICVKQLLWTPFLMFYESVPVFYDTDLMLHHSLHILIKVVTLNP